MQSPCDTAFSRVAEVRGRVAGVAGPDVTEVYLFDGFALRRSTASGDGSFCLPVVRSTPGTFVTVFATRRAFLPAVRNLAVTKRDTLRQQPGIVTAGTLSLQPSPDPRAGTLVGVAYVQTVSGRPHPHEGILEYDRGLDITVQRTAVVGGAPELPARAPLRLRTDSTGVFTSRIAPGAYRLVTSRNAVVDSVVVTTGRTTVVPVLSGRTINF